MRGHKRSYGTGSIRQVAPGKWRIHVRAGTDERGRPKRLSEVIYSRRKPEDRLREILHQVQTGQFSPGHKDTVRSFFQGWWPAKSASLAPSGALGLKRLYEKYMLPSVGDRPINKVSTGEISRMVQTLVDRGRVGQAQHLHTAVRMFFNAAIKAQLVYRNPTAGVERPAKPHREMVSLTPDQWRLIRNYLIEKGSWAVLPFSVLVTTGMRRSELCGLRWHDFDAGEPGALVVLRSLHVQPGGQVVVGPPKSKRGKRRIPVDTGTRNALLDHQARSRSWAEDQGRTWSEAEYIFAREDGTPCRPDTLTQHWDRTMAALGLRCRLHDLRHTAASLLLASGSDYKDISARLGHSSTAFTMDVYAHLHPSREAETAERLAALLNGASLAARTAPV